MALVMASMVSLLLVLCAQEATGFAVFFAGAGAYNGCSKPVAVGTTVMGRQTIAETTFARPVGFRREGEPVTCGGTFKRGESLTAHIASTEQGGTYNSRQEFVLSVTGGSFVTGGCDGARIADTDAADLKAPTDDSVLTLVAAWPDIDYDVSMFPQLRVTSVCTLYPEDTTTILVATTTIATTTPVITTTSKIASSPSTTEIAVTSQAPSSSTTVMGTTSIASLPSTSRSIRAPSTTEQDTVIETSSTNARETEPVATSPIVKPVATNPPTTTAPPVQSTGTVAATSTVFGSESEVEDEDISSGTCKKGQFLLASMALVIVNIRAFVE